MKELYLFYLTTPPKLHFILKNYAFLSKFEVSLRISLKNDLILQRLDAIILGEDETDEIVHSNNSKISLMLKFL